MSRPSQRRNTRPTMRMWKCNMHGGRVCLQTQCRSSSSSGGTASQQRRASLTRRQTCLDLRSECTAHRKPMVNNLLPVANRRMVSLVILDSPLPVANRQTWPLPMLPMRLLLLPVVGVPPCLALAGSPCRRPPPRRCICSPLLAALAPPCTAHPSLQRCRSSADRPSQLRRRHPPPSAVALPPTTPQQHTTPLARVRDDSPPLPRCTTTPGGWCMPPPPAPR